MASGTPQTVQVFVDFWNFTLNWQERAAGARIDWRAASKLIYVEAIRIAELRGFLYAGTRVYASFDPVRDASLRRWLHNWLDRQPGVLVFARERRSTTRILRCRECQYEFTACPNCAAPWRAAAEKGVDAAIVTDMFSLAWESGYGVAVLASSDGDFVPAVKRLQEKGIKVINATWKGYGHQLARECWASFEVDALIPALTRRLP